MAMHSEYVKAAQKAIAHVQATVRYRGLNVPGNWLRHPLETEGKFIARLDNQITSWRLDAAHGDAPWTSEERIQKLADVGRQTRTGNCSELSAIAFQYLQQRGVAPLEYFAMWRGSWSHAFLVLNRDASIPVEDFGRWSYDAVLCDPLYDRAADAGHLSVWYPSRFPLREADLMYRWDGTS